MQPARVFDWCLRRLNPCRPYFATSDVVVGRNVVFGRNVSFHSKRVRIGDGVVIHDRVRVEAESFEIGDYGTLYPDVFVPGPGQLRIGHNFWAGTGVILDAMGGMTIGNNVCVAAGGQLWTHMKFGDRMAGCRFHSSRPTLLGDDVWLGAHTLAGPVTIGDRALVMMGSLVTHDIGADQTWAGNPALDRTERFGPQFEPRSAVQRKEWLEARLAEYDRRYPRDRVLERTAILAGDGQQTCPPSRMIFDVLKRTYTKQGFDFEVRLMRFLLPDAKFVPVHDQRNR